LRNVTVVDVVVDLVFGIAIGIAMFSYLAVNGRSDLPLNPFVAFGVGLGLLQAAVDGLRGRGWRYALACGGCLGVGTVVGGYAALAGTVIFWAVMAQAS
jgi:hypothetical protein